MAKLGTITLTGKSGGSYSFNIWPRDTEFKEVGAIYVMSKVNANGRYDIIYVGQTGDLSSRPLNHHKTACFDKHKADKLLIHLIGDERTRLRVEADLIDRYDPPCNG